MAIPGFRRRVYFFITAFASALALGFLATWIVAGQLVAARPQVIGSPSSDLPVESITLHSKSGSEVAGWHIPADSSQGVVVLLHGV